MTSLAASSHNPETQSDLIGNHTPMTHNKMAVSELSERADAIIIHKCKSQCAKYSCIPTTTRHKRFTD